MCFGTGYIRGRQNNLIYFFFYYNGQRSFSVIGAQL